MTVFKPELPQLDEMNIPESAAILVYAHVHKISKKGISTKWQCHWINKKEKKEIENHLKKYRAAFKAKSALAAKTWEKHSDSKMKKIYKDLSKQELLTNTHWHNYIKVVDRVIKKVGTRFYANFDLRGKNKETPYFNGKRMKFGGEKAEYGHLAHCVIDRHPKKKGLRIRKLEMAP